MSKRYEGFITVREDESWRGQSSSEAFPLFVDSESFDTGKEIINNNNLTRNGRAINGSSQVSGATKPSATFTYQPRGRDILSVLFSHFQFGSQYGLGTTPGTYVLTPSLGQPNYDDSALKRQGGWNEGTSAVYSVSFLKKYFNTTEYDGTNAIDFRHGICDSLTVNLTSGQDVTFDCGYKFRDLIDGTKIVDDTPSDSVGTYSTDPPLEGYHGTVTVNGETFELDSLSFTGNNNLVEKIQIGRENPETFPFQDYEVDGNFTLDFPKDGMEQIGSMFNLHPFSIVGTIDNGTTQLMFDLPYCIRQPFNVSLDNDTVVASIPFKAFENGGNSPITMKLIANATDVETDIWDAWYGARTFADFGIADAGNGARDLGEYTYADRDL